MLPAIHTVSFSDFRANSGPLLRFVTRQNGNLWLTRYRRPFCAVIPMRDAHVLGEVQGRDVNELIHRIQVDANRHVAAARLDKTFDRYEVAGEEWTYPIMEQAHGRPNRFDEKWPKG
ncbi:MULTISPECIES: hypothetical protein [Roseobacteraceae]|jgi:hypothetical protein|uniref:Uncharacterized protein n=1 Tax=Pseudosulfitobacter pseudonitzschiae TaxID=1402135 RepID=A0A221JWF8_9RHOB|nr:MULTISPECIES: hypothetical protein [Roseobacteraceae]ASM71071.1 hypothetical protein SULPSESMR1_00235 [Pseudosulfitobacter pseudonitzschiae]